VTSEDFPYNVVGIGEDDSFNLSFFPNPSNGIFYYNSANLPGSVQLAIYDIHGKLIKDIHLIPNQGTREISLSVESGLYFFSVLKEDILISGGKFIVEK